MTRPATQLVSPRGSVSEAAASFWSSYQPGFRFSPHTPGTSEFYSDVERHRYRLEPHIPELARFETWANRDVLEVGCGIGTDGAQFARHHANYTGVDSSPSALELARQRFDLEQLPGRFERASATELPFPDESVDLVYSHGVIHHIEDTGGAVREFHRVLRPGGLALVMLYHRNSFNYYVNIMLVRRLLATVLLMPGAAPLVARVTRESPTVLEGQRRLLRHHGLTYLTDRELFLSNNTDGPGNPLSKVYTRAQATALFEKFDDVAIRIRYLNLRLLPGGERLARVPAMRRLQGRLGWHLYVLASK